MIEIWGWYAPISWWHMIGRNRATRNLLSNWYLGKKITLHKPNSFTHLIEASYIQWGSWFPISHMWVDLITCFTSSSDKIGASYIQSSVHRDFRTNITFFYTLLKPIYQCSKHALHIATMVYIHKMGCDNATFPPTLNISIVGATGASCTRSHGWRRWRHNK